MSADATTEEQQEETQPPPAIYQTPPEIKTEYLVRSTVRTMLGNPSALYHGKMVVVRSDIREQIMSEAKRRKEERKRRKEEKRKQKLERRRQWEAEKKRMKELAAQRKAMAMTPFVQQASVIQQIPGQTPPFQQAPGSITEYAIAEEETGPSSEAIYCNTCGGLSYGSRIEYEYSVSSHLTAMFLCFCCYCWLPYVLRCCMDEVYYCQICGAFLGKTSTLSRRKFH